MVSLPGEVLAYREPVDMRKSFSGLLGVVREHLEEDPLSGTLFIFMNKRGNYLKGIYWDRTGYCLFAKRLVKGRFRFPLGEEKEKLSEQVFKLLLDGVI